MAITKKIQIKEKWSRASSFNTFLHKNFLLVTLFFLMSTVVILLSNSQLFSTGASATLPLEDLRRRYFGNPQLTQGVSAVPPATVECILPNGETIPDGAYTWDADGVRCLVCGNGFLEPEPDGESRCEQSVE